MQRKGYEFIPVTNKTDDVEEGKYTTMYTDVGNFEILVPLDELMEQIRISKEEHKGIFKYRKLDEYNQVMQNFGELVLDLNEVKIMGYKEHHIIDNLKLARELETKAQEEQKEKTKK